MRINNLITAKTCSKCKVEKDISNFSFDRSKPSIYRADCKECRKAVTRRYYSLNKEKFKDYHNKQKYSITSEEYKSLIANGCEVCGSFENLVVDHDHKSGKVRGCLCNSCNCAEGYLKGDINIMLNLIEYVTRHKK